MCSFCSFVRIDSTLDAKVRTMPWTVVMKDKAVPERKDLFFVHLGDIVHPVLFAEIVAVQIELTHVKHRQTVGGGFKCQFVSNTALLRFLI